MKVGLFDIYASGHHLPYADIVNDALTSSGAVDTEFITLSATDRQTDIFDPEDIIYLDSPDSPVVEDRDEPFIKIADRSVSRFISVAAEREYDVVHFLYADDILGPIWRHWSSTDQTVVGDLVGPFFTRWTLLRRPYVHPLVLRLLWSPVSRALDFLVPDTTTHESLWRDLLLYRTLRENIFDRLVLHSQEAVEYVDRMGLQQPMCNVPFPVQANYRECYSQTEARERLALPQEDTILLFFGTLRQDKGIGVLLRALREYTGPPFTQLIAGPPSGVEVAEIEAAARHSPVRIVSRLEYIDEQEAYYRAADAVVMPYTPKFGKENMSMIFQEACGALRPLIVSDFGVHGRLTEEWDLGLTFRCYSAERLADALSAFVAGEYRFSEHSMEEYARKHSYSRTLTDITTMYETFEH